MRGRLRGSGDLGRRFRRGPCASSELRSQPMVTSPISLWMPCCRFCKERESLREDATRIEERMCELARHLTVLGNALGSARLSSNQRYSHGVKQRGITNAAITGRILGSTLFIWKLCTGKRSSKVWPHVDTALSDETVPIFMELALQGKSKRADCMRPATAGCDDDLPNAALGAQIQLSKWIFTNYPEDAATILPTI